MSDTAVNATKKYKVIAEMGVRIDRPHRQGDTVELTDDQARYLLFNSKIELAEASSLTPAETKGASHKPETK